LPHVGNDIVDLTNPVNVKKPQDLRYLRKILTSAEIEFVHSSGNQAAALWSLWTCKETAYKVMKKSAAGCAFLPRQWNVRLNRTAKGYDEGEVIIPEEEGIFTRLFICDKYVHCIGADSRYLLDKVVAGVDTVPPPTGRKSIDSSSFGRGRLLIRVAEYFHLNLTDLKVKRVKKSGDLLPPFICLNGHEYPVDVSLSHDGNFVAYSFIGS
jgi:hypothetical protein